MKKILALTCSVCFISLFNTAYAANCTITVDAYNVNLNLATTKLTTLVNFTKCAKRVRPSWQWSNTQGNFGVLYLDNDSSKFIAIPSTARVGGHWNNTVSTGGSQRASDAVINFDSFFYSSSNPNRLELYTEFSLSDFGDLSRYPAGNYRTIMLFTANEF